MKKILLLFFFVPLLVITSNASGSDVEDKLSGLEKSTFNRIYSEDDLSTRLSRLEQEFFGAKQSGTLDKRLEKLTENSYYCDTPVYDDYSSYIYQTPDAVSNSNGGFWNRLKRSFDMGTFTGYSPSFDNSAMYGSSYSSVYSPFSNPFYRNKFSRPYDYYRYHKITNDEFMPVRRINPFIPRPFGISDRNYSSIYTPSQPYHTRFYNPNRVYNRYRPTNYNTKTSIGTKVTLID